MIRRLAHVGISVRSLDRSITFYRDCIGLDLVVEDEFSGENYERLLGLPKVRGRVALLTGNGCGVELFEFEAPTPRTGDPDRPVNDHGITHFCLEIEGLDGAFDRLTRAGMRFHAPPITFFGTTKALYGRDPDGNVIELVEPPE